MSLRDSSGGKKWKSGNPILHPVPAPAGQCLLIVLRSASTFSMGLFLTCQARLYRSQINVYGADMMENIPVKMKET